MEPETLNAMNESLRQALLWAGALIALAISLFALIGFAIYLGGFAWFCWTERPRPARRTLSPAQPQLAEDDWPARFADRAAAKSAAAV